jgi:Flp pilus assembly pilin Flp
MILKCARRLIAILRITREYVDVCLIAALVSVAAITALTAMGSSLDELFNTVSNELNTATNSVNT